MFEDKCATAQTQTHTLTLMTTISHPSVVNANITFHQKIVVKMLPAQIIVLHICLAIIKVAYI